MFRLTQVLRNTFIRLEAFFSVFFQNFFKFFSNFFGLFGKLLGFSKSDYFLESNDAQGIKRTIAEQKIESEPTQASEVSSTNRRRRPNPQMDYYLRMAQEVKKD